MVLYVSQYIDSSKTLIRDSMPEVASIPKQQDFSTPLSKVGFLNTVSVPTLLSTSKPNNQSYQIHNTGVRDVSYQSLRVTPQMRGHMLYPTYSKKKTLQTGNSKFGKGDLRYPLTKLLYSQLTKVIKIFTELYLIDTRKRNMCSPQVPAKGSTTTCAGRADERNLGNLHKMHSS